MKIKGDSSIGSRSLHSPLVRIRPIYISKIFRLAIPNVCRLLMARALKLPYCSGTTFLVPLRSSGFARGVVARASPTGRILLGYFFGPILYSVQEADLSNLMPDQALIRLFCGDLGLVTNRWITRGMLPLWKKSDWAVPLLVRLDPLGQFEPRVVKYSDDDPRVIESEYALTTEKNLGEDCVYGAGAVEKALTRLLKNK